MHENGLTLADRRIPRASWARPLARAADGMLLARLQRAMRNCDVGRLHLTMPSGATVSIGAAGGGDVHVRFRRYRGLWRLMRSGSLGFAEAYIDGDVEVDDLAGVFRFYYDNETALTAAMPALLVSPLRDKQFHVSRRNTRVGSRKNIAAHYDLGNAFYELWLDASMLYSSGIYGGDVDTLEAAQAEKIRRTLAALELAPGHSLIEIGCGWGAMAIAAGRHGAKVDAITISREQLAETCARVGKADLKEQVHARFEDYRDTRGTYDRLVSIEMIEAVGEENWPVFFGTVAGRLEPGGVGVIQAITINDTAFESYRRNPDFIQRYIFPGGMLPTIELMRNHAEQAGLRFEEVERFGASYARTLRDWRIRFDASWPRIEALGFSERFRRMWHYYLIYCETGFERGLIDVGLYRLRKPEIDAPAPPVAG